MACVSDIIQPKSFDVGRLSFGTPKKNANGGKTIYPMYAGKIPYVQTPVMTAPFGVSFFPGENGAPDKYSLDVSFAGMDSHEGIKSFYEFAAAVDAAVLDEAWKKSMDWFGKKYPSVEVLEAMRSPSIKMPSKEQYAPRFSMKLPFRDGKFTFPVYDGKRNEISLTDIINSDSKGKGSRVQAILSCSCWVVGPRFGVSWKVVQLRWQSAARLTGFAFVNTGDDSSDDEAQTVVAAPPARSAKKFMTADQASSDEEEEVVSKPKPSAKKKLVESSDEGDEKDGDDDVDALGDGIKQAKI